MDFCHAYTVNLPIWGGGEKSRCDLCHDDAIEIISAENQSMGNVLDIVKLGPSSFQNSKSTLMLPRNFVTLLP